MTHKCLEVKEAVAAANRAHEACGRAAKALNRAHKTCVNPKCKAKPCGEGKL